MINNLQLLRGLAALGVVFYHTNTYLFGTHTDFKGVSIFFVISGFLMVYVTRDDAAGFFLKRVARIVPFYWLMTLVAWFVFNTGICNLPALVSTARAGPSAMMQAYVYGLASADWQIQLPAIINSLFFVPTGSPPVLGVGWTLNIEMFFYALFALALTVSRKFAPAIVATVLAMLFCLNKTGDYGPIVATWGHGYVAFFVLGIGLFYLLPLLALSRAAAIAVSIALLAWWPYASIFQSGYVAIYLAPPAVVLAALLLDSAGVSVKARWALLFGGASYSLYLSHPLFNEAQRTTAVVWPSLTLTTATGVAVALIVSSAAAVLLYRYVEMPIIGAFRTVLLRRPPQVRASPAA